jgi:hypothetical protein
LAPGRRNRTPDAIAQKRPMISRSGPYAYSQAQRLGPADLENLLEPEPMAVT